MKAAMKRCRKECETEWSTRKKKKVDYFTLLHDDIVTEILTKIPADLLRYKLKHVCRRWFNIITNRILLDHGSLILQRPTGNFRSRLLDVNEHRLGLHTKEQYLDIPYRCQIKSWCNEFLLLTDPNKRGDLYIFNLITKARSFLPPSATSCRGHYGCQCGLGLSFDEFKGVYKVVHVFMGPPVRCEILVFKARDRLTWKRINGPSYTGQRKYYWDDPVSVQGRYLHWDVHCSKYLVSMDVVKERFRQTRLPESGDCPMSNHYSFVEMSGSLTLLHKVSAVRMDIWVLKDFQRTVWEKQQRISISNSMGCTIYPGGVLPLPVTGVRSKRFLIFRKTGTEGGLYGYDMKDKVIRRLGTRLAGDERCVVQSGTAPGF